MSNKVIVMHAGQKVCFAAKGRRAEHVLYARCDGERIRFTTKGKPLARIAGKGMAARVAEPVPDGRRDTFVLEELADGDTVQLTTPREDQRTCVYLEAIRGRIHLVGGASLIERIEGEGLRRYVEDEPEEE
ncbi:MAG TPA: hypothetical protein VL426_04855 [Candidatus Binatia bacterium]|jgi:hypothetical protein|nr:hypothetical protein [Candidatus Binatia bacterium]